jgi:aldose 1-epimerase
VSTPSGEQFEIRYGDQRAVVTEVGATIRHYSVAGRDVLDGFDEAEVAGGGRGNHLVPWPNRIRDGRYIHNGKQQQLALTEPANGNAMHGLGRWANWRVAQRSDSSVALSLVIHPQPGWPTILDVAVTVELDGDGLTVTTTARNSGSTSAPYGSGAHPYLTCGGASVDPATLQVPAGTYLRPDDRGIPVGPQPVDSTAYDFRAPRVIGDLVLDTAYRDVVRDPDGRWRVRLADDSRAVTLWGDEAYSWVQVFTGDTLPPGRARAGLAVEPMTCGPDAFNTGDGLVVLEPGESHRGQWGISVNAVGGR